MDTTTLDIIKICSGIIGGGLAGAILNQIISKRKARIQSIGKRVKLSKIFAPNELVYPHLTKITFSGTTSQNYHFDNLTVAQVEIINIGNKDFESFEFGITLNEETSIINVDVKGNDRHHIIDFKPVINFDNTSNIVDFTLTPFNRKDKYEINLFLTNEGSGSIGDMVFSSRIPIKFVDSDTIRKTFIEILKEAIKLSISIKYL